MKALGTSSADPIQHVSRPIVMLSKEYKSGYRTNLHIHARSQFLYAQSGTMRARTEIGSWIVPNGYGLLIPAQIKHEIEMFGEVSLKSAYIQSEVFQGNHADGCIVIRVSSLLASCIDRFSERPLEYEEGDIAEQLAVIIIAEIAQTKPSEMALLIPTSSKFKTISDVYITNPANSKSLDHWADELGLSRRSFTRIFRREAGMSFDQWRQRLRFQVATELLAIGQPMSHVASKVGYRSAAALKAMMNRHQ